MHRLVISMILAAHLLLPYAVFAQERLKDPLSIPLKTYGLMLGIALLGGFASWYSKVRKGEIPGWSIFHLTGELATSAFAGLLCFLVCEWLGISQLITAPLTGIAGHMGNRAVALYEEWAIKRAQQAGGS